MAAVPILALAIRCGADPKPSGPPPAIPVQVRILAEEMILDYDDYLASLTSRRSVTIVPQVSAYVQDIPVKPGDRVQAGAELVVLDPGQQQANLKTFVANLATRRASLAYAVENDESSKGLLRAGLLGELDYRQRHSQRVAAEADVRAAEAQVAAQRELLRFYRVTSPTAGVVGDVPVKVGDYVTPQSRLTSVDEDLRLEAYVYVPLDKVGALTEDTVVRVLASDGRVLCEEKPTFVSPRVEEATQSVLIKTNCPNEGTLRTSSVLTGRVVWTKHPGLLVPVESITRLAGQYFVFVAEKTPDGTVARQRPMKVAAIRGNDYVVAEGLTVGTHVVTSNLQKIRDGAPIAELPPAPGGPARGGGPAPP